MWQVGECGRLPAISIPLVLILTLVVIDSPTTYAGPGVEFGFDIQSAWTSDAFLQNPKGWGLYASKRLSQSTALRFSYSDLSNELRYRGDLLFGNERFDSSLHNLLLDSEAGARYYELTFHFAAVQGDRMQLDLGAGLGVAHMRVGITEVNSTQGRTFSDEGAIGTVSVGLTVNRLLETPISLRMGYQYRTAPLQMAFTTDDPNPMGDPSLSAVHVGLVAEF
jgi:hypothetical protein